MNLKELNVKLDNLHKEKMSEIYRAIEQYATAGDSCAYFYNNELTCKMHTTLEIDGYTVEFDSSENMYKVSGWAL